MMYTFIYRLPIYDESTIYFRVIDFENSKASTWLILGDSSPIADWKLVITSYTAMHKAFQRQGPSPFPIRRYIIEDAEHSLSLSELVDKYPEYFI